MSEYLKTGRYFREVSEDEDIVYEILTLQSDENICDQHNSGRCTGDIYYTDDHWYMTHWCDYHFKQNFKDGIFQKVAM